MSERPTPETDAEIDSEKLCACYPSEYVGAEFARKLERERDEAREAATEQFIAAGKAARERDEARAELDTPETDALFWRNGYPVVVASSKAMQLCEKLEQERDWITEKFKLLEGCFKRAERERDEAREERDHWKTEYEIVVARLCGKKHPRDNGIFAPDEVIPKLTQERDEARELARNLYSAGDELRRFTAAYAHNYDEVDGKPGALEAISDFYDASKDIAKILAEEAAK